MKKKQIALIIISIIVLIMALVVWWQFDNIKSVYFYFKYSSEDIDTMIRDSDKAVEEYLQENTEINVRPTQEVEEKLHQAGVITDEELVMIITGQAAIEDFFGTGISINEKKQFVEAQSGEIITVEALKKLREETESKYINNPGVTGSKASSESGNGAPGESKTDEKAYKSSENGEKEQDNGSQTAADNESGGNVGEDSSQNNGMAQISQYVAQMYVLKSTFSGQLSSLYNEAVSSYKSLPSSQRNENGKNSIIKTLYPKAAALEKSCDSQVSALLKELETLLVEQGQSTELVTKMRNAYYQEKSLVKAQYMNEL